MKKAQAEKPVLIMTELRGVFFGYMSAEQTDPTIATIERARMCVYFSADMRGVLGLASIGPSATCKIGPSVPSLTLNKVSAVVEVSPGAVEKWEGGPWA